MGRGERVGSKNNSEGRVWKRNVKSDDSDEDYMLEEDETDNQSDELDSLVGDASDEEILGSFVDEEEEEKVGNVVKPNSCKRSIAQRKNGIKSSRKRKRTDDDEDDEDYEEEEEEDVDADYSYGCGGGTSLSRFVNEVEEGNEKKVVRPKSHKRTTGRRKNGIGSSRKRKMIASDEEDDEDYEEEDSDVDADNIGGGCADLDSFVDEEEEEENVRKVVRPELCNRSTGQRENGTRSSRKRKEIVDDEDYYVEEDNDVDADNVGGGCADLDSFVDEEEQEENVRKVVRPEPCNRSTGQRENGTRSSRKRKNIVDDEDYYVEEDNDVDADNIGGGCADLDSFVDEEEQEENVRKVVRPEPCNRSTGQRENGTRSSRKRKNIVDDEDYYVEEDNDADNIGGGCADLDSFVDEEEQEENVRKVVRPEPCNRSTGQRENGTRSSRKRKNIVDDEDYYVEEDNDADNIGGGCADLDSFVDEEEQEENVRKVVRPEPCNRSTGQRENGTRSSRKRKRIVDDEDYYVEEDNDVDAESIDGGGGVLRAADSGDRVSDHDDYKEEEEDYEEEEDDDDEFTPEELDFLDEEEEHPSPKGKKGSVRSRNRKNGVKLLKKPQKNKRQGSSRSSKPTSSRSRKSVKKVRSSRGKCKRRYIHRRKKTKPCSDSDFAISEPSDYEFTISEEEREQVREANEFCRRSSNSRSSKQDQQDTAGKQLKKLPRRKGKEKVEEIKSDVGKQVCGICLTEEGKNTIRGTLDCCSHFFCFPCIMEWSKVESRCPLCKQRFYTISKSARSSTRIDLRNVVIHVPERDQVYQPSEEELRDYLDSYENVFCTECHEGGDDALMLLCDLCNSPSHTYCVGLGREVPDGNWYCEGCRPSAVGLTTSQAQDLTPAQRSNNISLSEPTFENMSEIDLNITIPETPMTPVNELLVSPRQQPSGVTLQAPSPVSSVGVSTLFGRRRVHRLQYLLSSNRLSHMAMRVDRSFSFDRTNFSGSWEDRAAQSSSLDTPTAEVGSSYNAEYIDRLQENPFSPAQNRESFPGRLSLMRGQPQSLQALSVADSSAYGINLELNCVPGRVSLQPCTSRLNSGSETSTSPFLNQNAVEQQLQSLVKSHLKNLCRDINMDLGQDTFKQITVSSTHTILAASGLAHSRTEVHEIQPPNCGHSEALVGPQTSLIKNCCQTCFDSFVRDVVMTVTMGFKAKAPDQLSFRNY